MAPALLSVCCAAHMKCPNRLSTAKIPEGLVARMNETRFQFKGFPSASMLGLYEALNDLYLALITSHVLIRLRELKTCNKRILNRFPSLLGLALLSTNGLVEGDEFIKLCRAVQCSATMKCGARDTYLTICLFSLKGSRVPSPAFDSGSGSEFRVFCYFITVL